MSLNTPKKQYIAGIILVAVAMTVGTFELAVLGVSFAMEYEGSRNIFIEFNLMALYLISVAFIVLCWIPGVVFAASMLHEGTKKEEE